MRRRRRECSDFGRVDGENPSDVVLQTALADDLPELVKADLAVGVLVQVEDGLVDNLLELRVSQVFARHHLEYQYSCLRED